MEKEDLTLDNPDIRLMVRLLTLKRCQAFYVNQSDWDDVLQDVFSTLIQYNYVERYDPERGVSLPQYLYGLIQNHLSRRYRRKARERRLFESLDSNRGASGATLLDLILDESEFSIEASELHHDIKVLLEKIEAAFPYFTSVVYLDKHFQLACPKGPAEDLYLAKGYSVYPRSTAFVFYCLHRGWSQSDIADFFKVSKPWVSRKVKMIRSFKPFEQWAQDYRS
jgi:RNA polymerase sigma factor (sigma-70 family)